MNLAKGTSGSEVINLGRLTKGMLWVKRSKEQMTARGTAYQ